jgi:hypothetical protein
MDRMITTVAAARPAITVTRALLHSDTSQLRSLTI